MIEILIAGLMALTCFVGFIFAITFYNWIKSKLK